MPAPRHFCVQCGAALGTRVIEGRELEACERCDFVLWRDPKVVTSVVVEVDGGLLLGRRGIQPAYGMWTLPGGFVNDDEHPELAAVRECLEEICADVRIVELLEVYHVRKQDAASMVGVAYRAELAEGARPAAGDEMLEVRVFGRDEIPELAFPSHRDIVAGWLKRPRPP